MKADFRFKKAFKLEDRKIEADEILNKYPNRIPVICECSPKSNLPALKKTKYLVPGDMTVANFQFLIRKNIDLDKYSALFLITYKGDREVTITGDKTMREIYYIYRDREDKFLYIFYANELTWG